ncbi:MAG TPA: translation elongation factor Ts [Candidatus Nanoarchaeia archaeon]|nr:translation elongation factor Ts [Candidatus Nanoarchaeia archaeon]
MAISIEDIKKLRDMTGAGMMKAKEALEEAKGDIDKAVEVLRLSGAASAAKKSDREAKSGLIESYLHGGKIGVLVEINCETDFVARTADFKEFAHEIAMQVAAANPEYVSPSDVPEAVIEKEKSLFKAEMEGQNKPAEVIDKIVEGKMDKFYGTVCLTKQPHIKDGDKTIEQLTAELVGKLGENIVIRRFSRLELGVNDG